jgi:carbon-monoxide dehydrogenase large subunit
MRWSRRTGDVERAFASATHVVRGRYALPRLAPAPIEPRGCVAQHDSVADQLTVWCSAQDPHRPLEQLAHILTRPKSTIRVIVPDVGGAFGSKGVIAPEVAAAAVAAIDLERPVKWVEDRTENLQGSYQGRGIEGDLELALDADGRMLALRGRLLADLGAYLLPTTPVPPHTAAMLLTGCYAIPAAEVSVVGAQTHRVPTGPYRGAGRPDAAYLLERLVDDAARAIGIDRIELRRRNLVRSFPYRNPMGYEYDSGDYERCLDAVLELCERAEPSGDRLSGTGLALFVERAGGAWESAEVEVVEEDTVIVRSSSSPHGQGHETTFAQIAAERIGVPLDRIELRFGEVPGVGTFGSRSVAMAGSAVAVAVDRLIERGRELAAQLFGVTPADVSYEAGRFAAAGRALSLGEVAAAAPPLCASARFESDLVFSSGAYAAVVEVDRSTGRPEVVRVVAVDDAGTVINPLLARGQVIGGAVQGLGECLLEEVIYDETGQLRNATLMDYTLPSAADIPPIVTEEVVTPSPLNPLGAKGVGEGGSIGTLAAVANAVADALGRHIDPPFTPEKLWRALD